MTVKTALITAAIAAVTMVALKTAANHVPAVAKVVAGY